VILGAGRKRTTFPGLTKTSDGTRTVGQASPPLGEELQLQFIQKPHTSFNLAGGLAARGLDVLLVDSDPQGSTTGWGYAREDRGDTAPQVISMTGPKNLQSVSKEKTTYDHVVINGSARLEELLGAAIQVADVVIIPVCPSALDLYATHEVLDIVRQQQKARTRELRYALCVTQQIGGSTLAREVGGAAKELGVPLLESRMTHRVAFARAAQLGMTVQEYEPHGKAASETDQLVAEILTLLK